MSVAAGCKSVSYITLFLLVGAIGCAKPRVETNAGPWSSGFSPPRVLDTPRMHLEPLGPRHAVMDHSAAQSSREHLQRTLQWGSWPRPDMTVEENRGDLVRHAKEFYDREGYAYTVLRPDRSGCLGCVYLSPVENDETATKLVYWAIERSLSSDLDRHIQTSVLEWIRRDWPFATVVMPFRKDNDRGIRIAEELGLDRADESGGDRVTFVWRRP